jgi:RNA polymerase sigma-70 factor (ECF subfamily)
MLKSTPRADSSDALGVNKITLRQVFESEEAGLLRYAFSLTGRRAVAEEIVQDVFLQLHANWANVQSPKSWLARCVRNQAFTYLRHNRREVLKADDSEMPYAFTDDKPPEEMLLHMEATGVLRQILLEMDDSDRELIQLKYFEDMKYSDISQRTGLSVGNVGYRLHHILKALAARLQRLGIDGQS